MNKELIRLTEQDLHRIVKESVNRVINELRTALPLPPDEMNQPKGLFIVAVCFYDEQYSRVYPCHIKEEKRFNDLNEAMEFAKKLYRDKSYIKYVFLSEYDKLSQYNVQCAYIEIFRDSIDEKHYNLVTNTKKIDPPTTYLLKKGLSKQPQVQP